MNGNSTSKIIGAIFCILISAGCTTTRTATLTTAENEKIDLYVTKLPQRDYIEISYLQTDGSVFHTPQKLLDGLKKKAVELEADAIIAIKYDFQAWYPNASGIALKYVNESAP